MLSYQHGYHVGNFADVIKHVTLTHLLTYLVKKEKPLFFLETHAGRGQYSLNHPTAQKNKEFITGIIPVWQHRHKVPPEFLTYLSVIQTRNADNCLVHYPGSPEIAVQLLRPQDRLHLCEAHPKEFAELKKRYGPRKRVHIANQDGWLALKALLPPPEKRGLIFIDPSFELTEEYQRVPNLLLEAYQRFPQGMYCLWYPLTHHQAHAPMIRKLQKKALGETLHFEFFLTPPTPTQNLFGMGMWLINAPYTLPKTLTPVLDTCKRLFSATHGFYRFYPQ